MEKSIHIDVNQNVQLPDNIVTIPYKGDYLIISPETANWIVLKNEAQIVFFDELKHRSVAEAIAQSDCNVSDIQYVLTQIVARQFDGLSTQSSISGKEAIHFYLTQACNMRCPHCYMYAGVKKENELTTQEICTFLETYSKNGGEAVIFSGGEIAMRTDIYDICKCAYNSGLQVRLLSNGVLWTKEKIHQIAPFVNEIQISIDGYDEESNAKIRGEGNFNKALLAINNFIDNGVLTEVGMTPFYDEHLEANIDKYVSFIQSMIEKYRDKPFNIRVSAEMLDGRDVCLTSKDKNQYAAIANKIYSKFYNTDLSLYPFVQIHKAHRIMDNCIFGTLAISSTGDVFMCSQIDRVGVVANIKKNSIEEILSISAKAKALSNINNLQPCKNCELKYICGGGCRIEYFPSLAQNTHFDYDGSQIKPRRCDYSHKEYYYDLMVRTNELIFQ